MSAMTMPYRVKEPGVVQELQPGDMIAADVVTTIDGNDYWLEDVRITDEAAGRPLRRLRRSGRYNRENGSLTSRW